jgi:hypothetical protein
MLAWAFPYFWLFESASLALVFVSVAVAAVSQSISYGPLGPAYIALAACITILCAWKLPETNPERVRSDLYAAPGSQVHA